MEKIIDLYFSNKRVIVFMHISYLLMCVIITNWIMENVLGIYYSHPEKIEMKTLIDFVLSGQIVAPLVIFFITTGLFHYIKTVSFYIYYFFNVRSKNFTEIKEFICSAGEKFGWFYFEQNIAKRGKHFETYYSIIKMLNDKDRKLISSLELFNSLAFSFSIALWLCPLTFLFKLILTIVSAVTFLYTLWNLFFLYKVKESLNELEEINTQLELR